MLLRQPRPSFAASAAEAPSTSRAAPQQPFYDDETALLGTSQGGTPRFQRESIATFSPPSIRDTGTLRPGPEWYPAWMKYRRREDNYVFWQDKFSRCSLDVPDEEKRWTVFSTVWFTVVEFKFYFFPPALRFLFFLGWRSVMQRVYEAHKALVLWQCKLDAYMASTSGRAAGSETGSSGDSAAGSATEQPRTSTFSRTMALRRLHWKNSALGEALYAVNLAKTGRVHMLPPEQRPLQRPTFFWLF
ncbi:hypothetical protein FOA52_001177 [Chlamydomonas sp. UWO 241]|nr:hypothetical protein FOA52_001177 [Chlamydomonas sp. UWO 241]